eukprot:6419027-Lingulodinium_polyedra.AAC.1
MATIVEQFGEVQIGIERPSSRKLRDQALANAACCRLARTTEPVVAPVNVDVFAQGQGGGSALKAEAAKRTWV